MAMAAHFDNRCLSVETEIYRIKGEQEESRSNNGSECTNISNLLPVTECLKSTANSGNPDNEFHKFSCLPPELQLAVWELALQDCEQRVFEVEWDDGFSRVSSIYSCQFRIGSCVLLCFWDFIPDLTSGSRHFAAETNHTIS